MRVASELKLREYTARGLPFIFCSDDPDFDPVPSFALRIPSSEAPVDVASVLNWHGGLPPGDDLARRMRAYASARLNFERQARAILAA
jgi:hypothetical protein